ncbi:MAG: ABC-2 transporter permease [Candidatus Aminicenantes bacterium]|nr:ABC-2 transporter permease [Candidatus Aminicenantes bacterium]
MWALLKKNAFFFLLLTILFQALIFIPLHVSRLQSENPLELNYIFYTAQFIFWAVFLGVWVNEQTESKDNGYAFLKTIPARDRQIVFSKYVPAFLTVVANVLFLFIKNARLSPGTPYGGLVLNYLSLIGGVSLLLVAPAYLVIFGLGFSRVYKFLIGFWVFIIVFPILYREIVIPKTGGTLEEVVRGLSGIPWFYSALACTVLFWASFPLAVRLKHRIHG